MTYLSNVYTYHNDPEKKNRSRSLDIEKSTAPSKPDLEFLVKNDQYFKRFKLKKYSFIISGKSLLQ